MDNSIIKWEAPEYKYQKKSHDWFWAVWIIALSISIASIIYQNILFAVLIIIGSFTLVMYALRQPRLIRFELNKKGVKIEDSLYPYKTLKSFWVQEEPFEEKLLIQSNKILMPLISIPLGKVDIVKIKNILIENLEEEEIEEPLSHKIMESLGF